MKRIALALLLLWLLLSAPSPVLAQSSEWGRAVERFHKLVGQGRYAEAKYFAKMAHAYKWPSGNGWFVTT